MRRISRPASPFVNLGIHTVYISPKRSRCAWLLLTRKKHALKQSTRVYSETTSEPSAKATE